jgi:hypothetical protein
MNNDKAGYGGLIRSSLSLRAIYLLQVACYLPPIL